MESIGKNYSHKNRQNTLEKTSKLEEFETDNRISKA